MTTEHGILMSAPMVRAILDGRKTQTRRVVSPRNSLVNGAAPCMKHDPEIISAWPNLDFGDAFVDPGPSPMGNAGPYMQVAGRDGSRHRVYPRVQSGDRLWVRETFAQLPSRMLELYLYRADMTPEQLQRGKANGACWRPSIYMPRTASRITLAVTSVQPERLQDITESDARAEGICWDESFETRAEFGQLWQRINGKRPGCAWADNPWVWAISFVREGVQSSDMLFEEVR